MAKAFHSVNLRKLAVLLLDEALQLPINLESRVY